MDKIRPCLWFENEAEEAANYYVSLLPDSKIDHVQPNVTETPSGPEGSVLVVEFTLAGRGFMALNGDTRREYNDCVSFSIDCEDQAEVDRLWSKLLADGGKEVACGWIRDRFGVPWQIVPRDLLRMLADQDKARAKRVLTAMMSMVKIDVAQLRKAYNGG
jgi:predicted 3-demethylubiquinone-9 3-methyltransferase (glyoxalase superfamily)